MHSTKAATSATLLRVPSSARVPAAALPPTAPTRGRGSWLPRWFPELVSSIVSHILWSETDFFKHNLIYFLFASLQCLRLLMHTFNREYSQVSSSASESKVSPSPGPVTQPINPYEPNIYCCTFTKYSSPTVHLLSVVNSFFVFNIYFIVIQFHIIQFFRFHDDSAFLG